MDGKIWYGEPQDVYIGDRHKVTGAILATGGLIDDATGGYINNATVTAQVREDGDHTATAIGSPVTCTYVATSNGHYRGTIPTATKLLLTDGTEYNVWVTSASGEVYRKLIYKAGYRGAK